MSEWDKLRNALSTLLEKEYKKNPELLDTINAWYRVRVVGDKLQEIVNKWDKAWKDMEADQQKLEEITKVAPRILATFEELQKMEHKDEDAVVVDMLKELIGE